MKQTIQKVMAQYAKCDPQFIGDYHNDYECKRCGNLKMDSSEDSFVGPCRIMAEYSPDGKVLLQVWAKNKWLADHWDELRVEFGVRSEQHR
jgi:hypothetical protein